MKDLSQVNGVKVETREPATMEAPSGDGSMLTIKSVDVCLLENGEIIYQCVHRNDPDCAFTADNVRSVTAHQRKHGDARVARQALATAAALQAELDERVRRRSEGSKRGAVNRRKTMTDVVTHADRAHAPAEIGRRSDGNGERAPIGNHELAKMAQNVITAWNALREAENTFQDVMIGYMRAAQVATDVAEVPPVDPEILEKARKFDELQRLMGK